MTPSQALAKVSARRLVKPYVTYSDELAASICARVGAGELLTHILAEDGMPPWQQWWQWVVTRPEVAKAYEVAKTNHAHSLVNEVQDIARDTLRGKHDPRAANVAINAFQWAAGKLAPKHYSDKHQQPGGVQLFIATTLNLSSQPRGQDTSQTGVYTLTARPVDPALGVDPPREPLLPPSRGRGSHSRPRKRTRKNHTSPQGEQGAEGQGELGKAIVTYDAEG